MVKMGDWGGRNIAPYSTPSQNHTSVGMSLIAAEIDSQFIIALGDNFYSYGITTNVEDARFAQTWHSIYTEASLQTPWYVCAGNHDHRGNVTAQIAYTAVSDIWEFPSLYHSKSFSSADGNVTVDIILIDTTNYTGVNSGNVYPSQVADPAQQAWIEAQLKGSTADYIIVAGHYPVYSVCSHGNTEMLIVNLAPLLNQYGAHYMSGHDHCGEHIVMPGTSANYWLNGMANGCCYQNTNMADVPGEALLYLIADTGPKKIDDDGIEEGVDGTIGGFSTVIATSTSMTVTYYNQNGTVLYTSSVPPRAEATAQDDDGKDPTDGGGGSSSNSGLSTGTVAAIVVGCFGVVALGGFAAYNYMSYSKRSAAGNGLEDSLLDNRKSSYDVSVNAI